MKGMLILRKRVCEGLKVVILVVDILTGNMVHGQQQNTNGDDILVSVALRAQIPNNLPHLTQPLE